MAKKKGRAPEYGTVVRRGIRYHRTRITGADEKRVDLYVETCGGLYQKKQEACRQVEEAIFCKENPTVAEYCEKWLLMQSAKISPATSRGYTTNMNKYIAEPLGPMYLSGVTADNTRLALIPLATESAGLYSAVNMLLEYVFYSAECSQLLDYNPCEGISAKGGEQAKKREASTDEQTKVLLNATRELSPYTLIMIALYSGLRREEILGSQWNYAFLDAPAPYISVRRTWRAEHNRLMVSTTLEAKMACRDIPIPKCLADLLREIRGKSVFEYVIVNSKGQPLSYSQFQRV